MVELRRILRPTDFSDISRHALEHAIVIAGWYGSQIVALHVGHPTIVLSTAVPIPVFTREIAPGDTHRQPTSKLPFKQLLCPVDFSDSSTAALRFAFSLAQESNARLTLLHVFEWPADEASARRVLETSEFHRQWDLETRHQLKALIPDDVRNWCTPEPTLAFGKAYQQILRVAATEHADLIVIGVPGRYAIDMMLFGSTAQQVVR